VILDDAVFEAVLGGSASGAQYEAPTTGLPSR
jgi:hypothetical protein